jgi:hypothetical protein
MLDGSSRSAHKRRDHGHERRSGANARRRTRRRRPLSSNTKWPIRRTGSRLFAERARKFGPITVPVNNAGIAGVRAPTAEIPIEAGANRLRSCVTTSPSPSTARRRGARSMNCPRKASAKSTGVRCRDSTPIDEFAASATQGRASKIKLNGVSVARRKRVKPASSTITFRNRCSPACAPSAGPFCASDTGTQISDDAP